MGDAQASVTAKSGGMRRHARLLMLVGLFVFTASIYLLSASGRDYSSDGGQYYYTAESLLRGETNVDDVGVQVGARLSDNGHYYTKGGLTQSLVELPALVILRAVLHLRGEAIADHAATSRAWVPIMTSALVSAATILVMFMLVNGLGYGFGTAAAMSLLLGFTTQFWVYAKLDLAEPLQCSLLLVAFWRTVCARPPIAVADAFVIGLAIGLLALVKAPFVLLAPIAWVALLWRIGRWDLGRMAKVTSAQAAPVIVCGLTYLVWNYARWGSAADFGFNESFDTPLLVGLYGLFFSSGKSVFLYAPILIAAVLAFPRFFQSRRFEAILAAAFTVPFVCFYAAFWAWHGDWAWGPRYMTPFIAIWMLPLSAVIETGGTARRAAIACLAAIGLFVQVLGIVVNAGTYLNLQNFQLAPKVHDGQTNMSGQAQVDIHFIPEFSPLAGHWWLFRSAIERARDPGKEPRQYRVLNDYPWLRAGRENWKPDHPEYGAILDLWVFDPPRHMGPDAVVTFMWLLVVLAGLGFASIAAGAVAARR